MAKVEIDDDVLGMLCYAATSKNRKLDRGVLPSVWDLLPQKWRDLINGGRPTIPGIDED